MKLRRISLTVLLCLAVWICGTPAQSVSGQEKIDLQLNMQKGTSHKVNFSMNMNNNVSVGDVTIDMMINMGMDMTFAVKDVNETGVHTVDLTYDRIKMKMTGPVEMDFDSAKKEEDPGPSGKIFGALAGETLTMIMNRQAKVTDVKGFEKLAEKLGVPKNQLESQRQQMTQMVAPLPDKPVGIGDSWESTMKTPDPNLPATISAKYTLTGRKDGLAMIKLDGTIKSDQGINGTLSGTMSVEEKTGWTKNADIEMKIKGTVQGAKMNMTGKMKFGPLPMQ